MRDKSRERPGPSENQASSTHTSALTHYQNNFRKLNVNQMRFSMSYQNTQDLYDTHIIFELLACLTAFTKTWTGRWTMDGGQWTMDGGQWTMDDGRWTVDYGPFHGHIIKLLRDVTN